MSSLASAQVSLRKRLRCFCTHKSRRGGGNARLRRRRLGPESQAMRPCLVSTEEEHQSSTLPPHTPPMHSQDHGGPLAAMKAVKILVGNG